MPKDDLIQHSVLIISASDQFDGLVKQSLSPRTFMSVEFRRSASQARRCILERFYDLVIINAPLPDENGVEISLDVVDNSNASVLLVVPKEFSEDALEMVTDYGVLVLPKPFHKGRLDKAVRFLSAMQNKIRGYEKRIRSMQEKAEDMRIINKAKFLLVEKKKMTEDEAHRFIGKTAMDNGISRKSAAGRILDDL